MTDLNSTDNIFGHIYGSFLAQHSARRFDREKNLGKKKARIALSQNTLGENLSGRVSRARPVTVVCRLSKRNVNPFNSQRFSLFTFGIQARRN